LVVISPANELSTVLVSAALIAGPGIVCGDFPSEVAQTLDPGESCGPFGFLRPLIGLN